MWERYIGLSAVSWSSLWSSVRPGVGTLSLALACIGVFSLMVHRFGEGYLGGGGGGPVALLDFYDRFGVSPALVGFGSSVFFAWASGLFVHVGPLHLLANLAFLIPFGLLTERRCGTAWLVTLYLACGVMGAVGHCWAFPSSHLSLVGASGAVAGLAGFVWVAVPLRKPVWSGKRLALPAYGVLLSWAIFQLLSAVSDVASRGDGPVAFVPHVVGLMVGLTGGVVWRLLDPIPVSADEVDRR